MDLLRTLPKFDRSAFSITVFTFLARGAWARRLEAAGIEVVGPFLTDSGLLAALRGLRRRWRLGRRRLRKLIDRYCPAYLRQIGRRACSKIWHGLSRLWLQLLRGARRGVPSNLLLFLQSCAAWYVYCLAGLRLIPMISKRRIDVIHTLLPSSYVVGSVAGLFTSCPVVMSRLSLNWYKSGHPLLGFAEPNLLHPRISRAVCNCGQIAQQLQHEGIPSKKIEVIGNGIDAGDFMRQLVDKETARRQLDISNEALVISVVANLHPYKGHADLLRALSDIDLRTLDWTVLLVGRDVGGNDAALRNLAAKFGLAARIRFLGERDDVATILSAADIHVSASHTEGLPNNVIEAMCAKLPVVATSVGGTPELIVDEQSGLLVPPHQPAVLGRAILRLAQDVRLRGRLAEAGHARVLSTYSTERAVEAFARTYGEAGAEQQLRRQYWRKDGGPFAGVVRVSLAAHAFLRICLAPLHIALFSALNWMTRARLALRRALIERAAADSGGTGAWSDIATAAKIDPALAVDVVIPVRNRALFIAACLDSVRAQTFQPGKVIVVDDGSTDDTPAILESYARDWPKLHVVRIPGRGASAARNAGIAATTAPLVAFLDSDDVWHPEKLALQAALFSPERPNLGIVHCGLNIIDHHGKLLWDEPLLPWKRGDIFDAMLNDFYHLFGSLSAVVIRRRFLRETGGFDESLRIAEDCDLFFRLARIAHVDYVPEALVWCRQHADDTYRRAAKHDREFVLSQRLKVWNKWIAQIKQPASVIDAFRVEARAAHLANVLRLDFGLYGRLRHSDLQLARQVAEGGKYGLRERVVAASVPERASASDRHEAAWSRVANARPGKPADDTAAEAGPNAQSPPAGLDQNERSDVSALIVTVGEPTTKQAIDSVRRQTYPVGELIMISNIAPAHKALNAGVEKITTGFFLQVDADMILDAHCVDRLRSAMRADVGIAVGYLRDELMKEVVGIKLFRTECFSHTRFSDSISPDTDFVASMATVGWKTIYVGQAQDGGPSETLGEHRPNYALEYTYVKYLMEGGRYRYRNAPDGLRWHLRELEKSGHSASLVAQIALARGAFRDTVGDKLGLWDGRDEFASLQRFLSAGGSGASEIVSGAPTPSLQAPVHEVFHAYYRLGASLFESGDASGFVDAMRHVSSGPAGHANAWLAKLALCQGLFSDHATEAEADCARLSAFAVDAGLLRAAAPTARRASGPAPAKQLSPAQRGGEDQYAKAFAEITKFRPPSYEPRAQRVLMVTGFLGVGGSERQTVATVSGLTARGFHVSLLSLEKLEAGQPGFEEEVKQFGAEINYIDEFVAPEHARLSSRAANALPAGIAERVTAIAACIEQQRPSIVHCWLDHPGIFGALAGCMLGVPRQIIQLGSTAAIIRRSRVFAEICRSAYRTIAGNPTVKLINNSRAGADDYENWIGLRRGTIDVVYNGFVPQSARMPPAAEVERLRSSFGLSPGTPVVGTLMRFVPEKDPNLWLETAAEVARLRPETRFLIFGYGVLEPEMRLRLETLGLSRQVILAGATDDAGLALSAMDVVLLTSAIEGLPNVMIEAQAVGRPVVATDVGGNSEGLLEGRTGAVVRPRSTASLSQAIIRMLDDAAWRDDARRQGPAFIADRFSERRLLDQMVQHYQIEPAGAARAL
jgi:glycosyltransferase involved in cell wall biosynthesis